MGAATTEDGARVVLTFSEALYESTAAIPHQQLTVKVDGEAVRLTGSLVVKGRTATFALATPVTSGQTWTVSFTEGITGSELHDPAENSVVSFTDQPVENNVAAPEVPEVPEVPASPDAPTRLRAAPGDRRVTLTWRAPASDGGSAITGYEYCRETGAAPCAGTGDWKPVATGATAATHTVTDLTNGTRYTFRVRAVNVVGAGEPSNAVTATPAATSSGLVRTVSAGFGRMVGMQAVGLVSAHLEGGGGSHVTLGGERLGGSGEAGLARLEAAGREGAEGRTGREVLLGSSFRFASGGDETGALALAAWGQLAAGRFETGSAEGEVTTGMVGADASSGRWLAGLALSRSRGAGSYAPSAGRARDGGESETLLTGLHPYARLRLGERVWAWGVAGYAIGELTLRASGGERAVADLRMKTGAVGGRAALVPAPAGFELALASDALWMWLTSVAAPGLPGTRADAQRFRLALDASRGFETGSGGTLTPRVEVGLRRDGGDAETGMGVEVGGGVRYARSAFAVEGRVRALAVHQASGYEEWGASGTVRLAPRGSGRGLSLAVVPAYGAASSAVERLWSEPRAGALAREGGFAAGRRLDAEVGYGLGGPRGVGVLTPFAGLAVAGEAERAWRAGARWRLAPNATFGLEAARREADTPGEPALGLTLKGSVRW